MGRDDTAPYGQSSVWADLRSWFMGVPASTRRARSPAPPPRRASPADVAVLMKDDDERSAASTTAEPRSSGGTSLADSGGSPAGGSPADAYAPAPAHGADATMADAPGAASGAVRRARAALPATAPPPAPRAPSPPAAAFASRSYTIGGLAFQVDTRYAIKSIVGKGAYGLVCAAEDLGGPPAGGRAPAAAHAAAPAPSGAPPAAAPMVAVKKVIDPFGDHTDCKRLLREIRLLRSLVHPNLLHLTDMMPPPGLSPAEGAWKDVYLVTRLFDTNLHRVIYSGHTLTDAHIQYTLWQVFRGLRYLHRAGVVHRDMKPTNVLLNRDCELALADFGLARYMPKAEAGARGSTPPPKEPRSKSGQLTKYVVTRWYRAPELLVQNRAYDAKVDMWSVGCILAELLGAQAIFPGKDSLHQLRLIIDHLGMPTAEELGAIENEQAVTYIRNLKPRDHGARASPTQRLAALYPDADPALLDLLAQLLQFDQHKRPTADEALAHPYLAQYRDAPEETLQVPHIEMDFEKAAPTKEQLRSLIWDEVRDCHPELHLKPLRP